MIHLVTPTAETPYQLPDGEPPMVGTLTSSVHRLKDSTEAQSEGAFFIFGDVSVRVTGKWRLRFTVYDVPFGQNDRNCRTKLLAQAYSNDFSVVQSKDFKGLAESSKLTRCFSDQGVRLRLRKEQRQTKRKAEERTPSEPPDLAIDKRQRYEDDPDQTVYPGGPVQALHHDPLTYQTSVYPGLSDQYDHPTGAVQAVATYTAAPVYDDSYLAPTTHIPESRYQERMQEHYTLLSHGAHGNGTFDPEQPF
jgi:hypothetical protein